MNCFIKFYFILGEISMQKVKVQRYISGKRPEYAPKEASDDSSNEEDIFDNRKSIMINKVRDLPQDDDARWVLDVHSSGKCILTQFFPY